MNDRTVKFGPGHAEVNFEPPQLAPKVPGGAALPIVQAGPTQWNGHYRIETAGKSAAEIVAAIDAVQAHHASKTDCMNRFAAMVARPIVVVGAGAHRWTDATIRERGTDHIELYLNVVAVDGTRRKCMPLRLNYRRCSDVPSNAQIVAMVQAAIGAEVEAESDHQQVLATVSVMLASSKP